MKYNKNKKEKETNSLKSHHIFDFKNRNYKLLKTFKYKH